MQLQINLFRTQQIYDKDSNNMPELLKPQFERIEIELENILRWEDDGGKIIGCGNPVDRLNPAMDRVNNKQMITAREKESE